MASGSVVEGQPGTHWPGTQCVPGQSGTQPLPNTNPDYPTEPY